MSHDPKDLPAEKDVLAFFEFLDKKTPYEAIDRVVYAGSDLETGMYNLLRLVGIEHKRAANMKVKHRVEWLGKKQMLELDVLARIEPALARRNLLAHGQWLNMPSFSAFVKVDRDLPDKLKGETVDERKLKEWHGELQELADQVRDAVSARRDAEGS